MKSIMFWLMMALVGVVNANEYYDYNNDYHIEITVRAGDTGYIEYYNHDKGEYSEGYITGRDQYGDLEVLDRYTREVFYLQEGWEDE